LVRLHLCLALFAVILAACQSQTELSPPPSPTPIIVVSSPTQVSPPITPTPAPGNEQAPPAQPAKPTETVHIPTPTTQVASVAALPAPNTAQWKLVTSGLNSPVGIASALDGSGRLFVLEQAGVIRIIQDGALLTNPFLDISGQVSCCGERGLLGLAFHPRYMENGQFFVNYTDLDGNTVIARFEVSSNDPNQADASSEKRLIYIQQPYPNHNGGAVVFGPDGYLYLGLGDGGSGGDPQGNGQSTSTVLGKILRIDVDGGSPYAIPADNPFVNGGGLLEIWAYGLRNPWRISFDRAIGDLYIGDVGQNAWEEIDFLPAGSPGGANFGWNYREGTHPYQGSPPANLALVEPIAEYSHDQGCSVTGGAVYRGSALPAWQGVYLYGDYCSGKVWGLVRNPLGAWLNGLLFETGSTISSFGTDEAGELYLVDYSGSLFKLAPAP
jgi:glucose/arabinose dehydrogenase